jgi:hypothetical protein
MQKCDGHDRAVSAFPKDRSGDTKKATAPIGGLRRLDWASILASRVSSSSESRSRARAARPRSRSGTDCRPSTCKCRRRVAPVIPDGLGSRADRARPCSKTSMEQGRQFCTSVGGGRRTRKNACNSGLPSAAQAVAGDVALMISRSCSASTSCISRCRSRVRACCATSYAKKACTSAGAELDARARELGVEHTSRMTKADLARAIAKKQR